MEEARPKTNEKLISEAVAPRFDGEADDTPVVVGEPIVPTALVWRGTIYPVLNVLSAGKGLGPCTHGSGEQYVHKHWYRFETTDSVVLRVYFERRPRARGKKAKRWWLYSIETPE